MKKLPLGLTTGDLNIAVYLPMTFSYQPVPHRTLEGSDDYLVVINTSQEEIKVDLLKDTTQTLPAEGTVVIRSVSDTSSATQPG